MSEMYRAFFVLGLIRAQEAQYQAAITLFKKAITLKRDKDEYHYHLRLHTRR